MSIKRGKLKTYIVWYSPRTKVKVKAFSAQGAGKQAWDMIAGKFTYGWSKADFLKDASVEKE